MSNIIKAGVIGDPISHSLSPKIHRYWLQKYTIYGQYNKYHVPCEKLAEFIDFAKQNLAGFNITTPHKQTILPYCDRLSDIAQAVGSVNTVRIDKGKIFGDNTDVYGLSECLRQNTPLIHTKTVCIVGAGGASRSAIQAFKQLGFSCIYIANRTVQKAEKLAAEFAHNDPKICIFAISLLEIDTYMHTFDVLVNTSVAGMNGDNPLKLNFKIAQLHMIVYDIVYKPLITPLLTDAQRYNLPIVTGIDMLLYQALLGFSYWFGVYPSVDKKLRELVI